VTSRAVAMSSARAARTSRRETPSPQGTVGRVDEARDVGAPTAAATRDTFASWGCARSGAPADRTAHPGTAAPRRGLNLCTGTAPRARNPGRPTVTTSTWAPARSGAGRSTSSARRLPLEAVDDREHPHDAVHSPVAARSVGQPAAVGPADGGLCPTANRHRPAVITSTHARRRPRRCAGSCRCVETVARGAGAGPVLDGRSPRAGRLDAKALRPERRERRRGRARSSTLLATALATLRPVCLGSPFVYRLIGDPRAADPAVGSRWALLRRARPWPPTTPAPPTACPTLPPTGST
jgi:hypothetical protein